MNNIERITKLRELEEQKAKLEKELNNIKKNIQEEKDNCSHISVDLGYYGYYPDPGNKYRCLICGKGKDEYFYEPGYIVDASEYLTQYDIRDKKQCDIKFDHIQTIGLGLLKFKPNMTRDQLVNELNNLIKESIAYKKSEEQKLEKKLK